MKDIIILILGFILGLSIYYVALELYRNRKPKTKTGDGGYEMKEKRNIWLYITIVFVIIVCFTIGFISWGYAYGINEALKLSIYACHDGCSIATKGSDGWLTNETWECWDECNEYIKELQDEFKQDGGVR